VFLNNLSKLQEINIFLAVFWGDSKKGLAVIV
jgi:hypothetical protein